MSEQATVTNGKPRKQLSDQLDRLDDILDLLAEGLPAAVADASREGTRLAVKDAILEIVSNPELRKFITPIPTPAAKPSLWERLKAKTRAATAATFGALATATSAIAGRCRTGITTVTTTARALAAVVPLRRVAILGLTAGATTAAFSFVAPHALAAAIAGVNAAVTTVAIQVGVWARRSFRAFGFAI